MLVYGDQEELADPRQRLGLLRADLASIASLPAGVERHSKLVGALVEAGRVLQGVADDEFAASGRDGRSRATDALARYVEALAAAVVRSWDSGFTDIGELPRPVEVTGVPTQAKLRVPEGYAFYALYPEAYIEAARRLHLTAMPRVIGIRSIGTSLGAIVAAALGAPPAITLRPVGDAAARELAVAPEFEREILAGDAHYVIVDEGPGQSGSSFGAVADWLGKHGIPLEQMALLPSHAGVPGPAATEQRRRWWSTVQREVGDFGDRLPALVERWCSPLIGHLDALLDISGGAWRALLYQSADACPAAVPSWERRKFLASTAGERFLVKFAGLGRAGEEKLAIARTLHSEGLVTEPIGLTHGFLVERWCEAAQPVDGHEAPVAELAHYIAARSRMLPATSGSGASVAQLLEMARRNISLELGEKVGGIVDRWAARADDLERSIVRVRTDNKVAPCEWLRTDGALIKTDALDHHQGHDLIGCQDAAWDVAGAIVEFELDDRHSAALVRAVEQAGCGIALDLLDCYRLAYLAFRIGQTRLGSQLSAPDEARRLEVSFARYRRQLQPVLDDLRVRDSAGTGA